MFIRSLFPFVGILILLWLRSVYLMVIFFRCVLELRKHLKKYDQDEYKRLFGDWFPIYSPVMGLRLWSFIILSNNVEENTRTQEIKQKTRSTLFHCLISIVTFLCLGLFINYFI